LLEARMVKRMAMIPKKKRKKKNKNTSLLYTLTILLSNANELGIA
jgi:hypothetical protein